MNPFSRILHDPQVCYFTKGKGRIENLTKMSFDLIQHFALKSLFKWPAPVTMDLKFRGNKQLIHLLKETDNISLNQLPFQTLNLNGDVVIDENQSKSLTISLFGEDVPLSTDLFSKIFDDPEKKLCLHRFGWLLETLHSPISHKQLQQCQQMILHWIKQYENETNDLIYECYSCCERVLNWLYFICLTDSKGKASQDFHSNLFAAIEKQLVHILENLEYQGPSSNNHILNNARALYISGIAFGHLDLQKIGQCILENELPNFIREGELIEGSTHYQHLLTRSMIEVHHASLRSVDVEFTSFMQDIVEAMIAHCRGLYPESPEHHQFPLCGDLSPDAPPYWFQGYPFCHSTCQQKSPWFQVTGFDLPDLRTVKPASNTWRHLKLGPFDIWVVCKSHARFCHAHADNGSITIFLHGQPLFHDPGRFSYQPAPRERNQMEQEHHALPVFGDFHHEPCAASIFRNNKSADMYSHMEVLEHDATSLEFKLTSFDQNITWNRKISWDADTGLSMIDRVLSCTEPIHRYRHSWNISIDYRKEDDGFSLPEHGCHLRVCSDGQFSLEKSTNGSLSRQYGQREPMTTLIAHVDDLIEPVVETKIWIA